MRNPFALPPILRAAADVALTVLRSDDSVEASRALYLKFIPFAGPPEPIVKTESFSIPGPAGPIPIRIYRPSLDENLPVALFFHGGWFCLGDLATHDAPVRAMANATNCVVVAVDYRLAPEHPFPAGPDDAWAATLWVANNARKLGVDGTRIAVVGDSAGGTLAAVVARRARDTGSPNIISQVLIYPVTDAAVATPSWKQFADGPMFTYANAKRSWAMYVPNKEERQNPDASPLAVRDLSGLPPALVITAELDPLRDEGEQYAHRLEIAGVPVRLTRYRGIVHGFFQMAGVVRHGRKAIAEIAHYLRQCFELNQSLEPDELEDATAVPLSG